METAIICAGLNHGIGNPSHLGRDGGIGLTFKVLVSRVSAYVSLIFNREKEIIRLLLAGNGNKEIADALRLTLNTVKSYIKLLTRKLGVSGRAEIVAAFVEKK
jgi:DNA-binding CsgD family transcriptional regulator